MSGKTDTWHILEGPSPAVLKRSQQLLGEETLSYLTSEAMWSAAFFPSHALLTRTHAQWVFVPPMTVGYQLLGRGLLASLRPEEHIRVPNGPCSPPLPLSLSPLSFSPFLSLFLSSHPLFTSLSPSLFTPLSPLSSSWMVEADSGSGKHCGYGSQPFCGGYTFRCISELFSPI